MKKILLLLMFPPLLISGCDKEKVKAKAVKVLAVAGSPALSIGMDCRTGNYTLPFFTEYLNVKFKVSEANRKGIIKAACVTSLSYVKDDFVRWADGKMSQDMRDDGCSAEKFASKSTVWLISKCPG